MRPDAHETNERSVEHFPQPACVDKSAHLPLTRRVDGSPIVPQ